MHTTQEKYHVSVTVKAVRQVEMGDTILERDFLNLVI